MDNVKVQNKKTKVVKEVSKKIASDYLGTKDWEMFEEKKQAFPKADFIKPLNNRDK